MATETDGAAAVETVTNVVFAGLGGQGVLKASAILADVAFAAGMDVKKSEIHGMAQRGGSVTSDVRFGEQVFSPMVPAGAAHYVVVLAEEEVQGARRHGRSGSVLIAPDSIDLAQLSSKKSLNVALLGVLSNYLPFDASAWQTAVQANLPAKLLDLNEQSFALGRAAGRSGQTV